MTTIFQKNLFGFAAELDGKYWGVQHADGQVTAHDFGPIDKAMVSEHANAPTDFTYQGSSDAKRLARARLVPVVVTTSYTVEPDGDVVPAGRTVANIRFDVADRALVVEMGDFCAGVRSEPGTPARIVATQLRHLADLIDRSRNPKGISTGISTGQKETGT